MDGRAPTPPMGPTWLPQGQGGAGWLGETRGSLVSVPILNAQAVSWAAVHRVAAAGLGSCRAHHQGAPASRGAQRACRVLTMDRGGEGTGRPATVGSPRVEATVLAMGTIN